MVFPRHRRLRPVLLASAVLALIVGSFWLVSRQVGPLAGELNHDFGTVSVRGNTPTELTYSFKLTNITDDLVRLVAARPDCGCVNARGGGTLPANILPGQTFELPITMALQQTSKVKEVIIYLELGDGREQKLHVKAHGVAQTETDPAPPTSAPGDR